MCHVKLTWHIKRKDALKLIVSNSQCWVAAKSPCLGLEGQVLGLEGQVLGLDGQVLGLDCQVLGLDGQVLGLDGQVLGLGLDGQVLALALKVKSLLTSLSIRSKLFLPFWYCLTRVVLDKRPLNGCCCLPNSTLTLVLSNPNFFNLIIAVGRIATWGYSISILAKITIEWMVYVCAT